MVAKVVLSGGAGEGLFALVDDEDFEKVSKHKWYLVNGRPRANFRTRSGRQLKLHHFVFGKPPNGLVTDHINGDPLDNQKNNLRFVTHAFNVLASRRGSKGYYYDKSRNKWAVSIGGRHGSKLNGGRYDTEEEAAQRALDLRQQLHGEY